MQKESISSQGEWKRNLVLLAKNTYVWLHQLGAKYHTQISRLDQIPQAEIREISSRGFNSLWLLGLWERSPASRQIKHLYGREETIASAYSIYKYQVAADLGGEDALAHLKEKVAAQNIRLASDIVPNHTGLDSSWLFEHPDWYISTETNPMDCFTFNSPNLSPNPAAGIYLEEGYFTQTGAAEVFKYISNVGDNTLYIYHGNDGTSMPWNDTAQLNYLVLEVRQAVMDVILSVARKFNVIRLDAAMTLVREHFKRLWFPSKGGKKFIPTRGNNNMTDEEFDRLMPDEFWKEVIQKINREAPETLLIAEAFWLMEKYFINEIGMHRVYNSAFMHQLRDEENAEFKRYLTEILQSDPAMLERFTNFLTTPDERTAVEQFGKTQRYFGACKLLACMPGLPLFGHGQWEGLQERYGMDISRPMQEESPDPDLVKKHDEIITPLLKNRRRFSSIENFVLYDFLAEDGSINDDVIAFSNHSHGQRTLVIFNNHNSAVTGSVHKSINQIFPSQPEKKTRISLTEALNLPSGQCGLILFKDLSSGETRTISIEKIADDGISFYLAPYESHVYNVEF